MPASSTRPATTSPPAGTPSSTARSSARHREWGHTLADAVDCRFELVRVTCDESAAVERVADRDLDGELSDASLDTSYQIMKSFEEVSLPHVRIDNSRSVASTELQVERWCDQLR